jgi:hypothetical protein
MSKAFKSLVRDLVDFAWTVNGRRHGALRRGDGAEAKVLGGVKLVELATAYTVDPDWFRVGAPDDTVCGRLLAVTFLDDGRRVHVPKATWLDLVGPTGLSRWINP